MRFFTWKDTSKKVCKHCICRVKGRIRKRVLDILSKINKITSTTEKEKEFTIAVQDESIFVHDVIVKRKLWIPRGIRPVVVATGSHQKTCVFGTLTLDGKQLFRQYDVFN